MDKSSENEKKLELRGSKSLKFNIMLLCDMAIVIVIVISMIVSIPNYYKSLKQQVKNNIENFLFLPIAGSIYSIVNYFF